MGVNNRFTRRVPGVKRIQGESGAPWAKLGIKVSKRTIQRSLRQVRPPQPSNQTWATFLRNHVSAIWACDFLKITDIFFQPIFASSLRKSARAELSTWA